MAENSSVPYGLLGEAAIATHEGRIEWIGKTDEVPSEIREKAELEDLGNKLVTPGLIDCHTHLVHGGNRAREFEMRLEGASYEEVARAGGGILSTVRHTRSRSEEELVLSALPRLDHLISEGVTTVEIKSGYGLTIGDELKMLRAARQLERLRKVRIKTSYLGAHAIPAEYSNKADDYISEVCLPALEQAAAEGLVDAVDAFCEGIAFSPDQVKRVFECARELGLPVKIHAEQLSDLKGTVLASSFNALSADHLEYLQADGVQAMKESGMVAVLLPGAFYTLREKQLPPVEELRATGVPMALATDCNPGSSPLTSLLLTLNMACTLFRFTPEEALSGITRHAADALGLGETEGTLETGKTANLAIWDVEHPSELAYRIGFNPLIKRVYGDA
ncbi:imidazolonepropionase [Kiloniella sp. b19]|uniref:imidazolonepropionase n=1 Tax=Kiloniella sp. GXU_MW_B19 TaxID=3141326 RepID=UPI0031CE4D40